MEIPFRKLGSCGKIKLLQKPNTFEIIIRYTNIDVEETFLYKS